MIKELLIRNAAVLCDDGFRTGHGVYCRDGVIKAVLPDSETRRFDIPAFDAGGKYLVPGFIDLHFHGARMRLVEKGPEELAALCGILPEFGVTGFLPTICPMETGDADLALLRSLAGISSPLILGFFLEGHYLNLTGAIKLSKRNLTAEHLDALIQSARPYRAVFAVSPELEGIETLLPEMRERGAAAFITHTRATAEQTERAIALGASHATHFYDVYPYPGEKEPGVRGCGVVEAVMAHPEASVDFILDGEHVEPVAVRMALACKGAEKVCLITDANICAGMPAGVYEGGFSGLNVSCAYPGAPARLCEDSGHPGALAGSGLTMDLAVKNAVSMLDVPLEQAVRMASANPAGVLGLSHRKGRLSEGWDADFTLLTSDYSVAATWVAGSCEYINENERGN